MPVVQNVELIGSGKTDHLSARNEIHFHLYMEVTLMHYPEVPST